MQGRGVRAAASNASQELDKLPTSGKESSLLDPLEAGAFVHLWRMGFHSNEINSTKSS